MYIIKNALRCLGRSKGRNVLIGIIALVIAISACIGLSIRQASYSAKENALSGMSITANISYDRSGAMSGMMGGGGFGGGSFDRDQFAEMMGSSTSLTLDEYLKYAEAESVENFYYTLTAYLNGSEEFDPVTTETDDSDNSSSDSSSESSSGFPGNMGGFMGDMMGGGFMSGDFTIIGYSSDSAMTEFANGTASIVEGSVFDEGTESLTCIISEELASFNNVAVGNIIVLTNMNNEEETISLEVVGIYSSTNTNDFSMNMFGASQDPANRIYMSANAVDAICNASLEENSDEENALTASISATYVFENVDKYYAFEDEARALGLSDKYTISSGDISSFEASLAPLETLGTMAGWFLVIILVIGAVILVVLNIFNVRERKYEIGVLTAMGMKKWKVATQFICEILIVTMIAVVIGAGVGAVCSVPVTNALLENQISTQNSQQNQIEDNFGRPGNFGGMMGGGMPDMGSMPEMGGSGGNLFKPDSFMGDMFGGAVDYVTEIDSAMNLTVVFQMIGIGILLTFVASSFSVLFVMRYDPLKILANRD